MFWAFSVMFPNYFLKIKMILDKNIYFKDLHSPPHPPNWSFSFYGRMFGVENWGYPSEIPLQRTFLCCFRRTIFLNSNPFIVLISRKGILNKVNKSSEFQGKFAKYCHLMQILVRFWLLMLRWCLNVDYLYLLKFTSKAGKVNINRKRVNKAFGGKWILYELRDTKL